MSRDRNDKMTDNYTDAMIYVVPSLSFGIYKSSSRRIASGLE